MFRCHKAKYSPIFFNFSTEHGRFNAPNGEFGILYAGADEYCAFVETFGDIAGSMTSTLGTAGVTETEIATRCLCAIQANRALRLVDLTGPGLAQVRADSRLCDGDWHLSQQWSLAFWSHPQRPDGLFYRARHDPERKSVALYDRVRDVLAPSHDPAQNILDDRSRLAAILEHYTFALVPDLSSPFGA